MFVSAGPVFCNGALDIKAWRSRIKECPVNSEETYTAKADQMLILSEARILEPRILEQGTRSEFLTYLLQDGIKNFLDGYGIFPLPELQID